MTDKPTSLFAWIADGEDSFCAFQDQTGTWLPLVFAKEKNAQEMAAFAVRVAELSGKTMRLVRFDRADQIGLAVEPNAAAQGEQS